MLLILLSVAIGVLVVTNLTAWNVLKQVGRSQERERNSRNQRESELLDRIMFLSGHAWNLPQREETKEEMSEEEIKRIQEGWEEV